MKYLLRPLFGTNAVFFVVFALMALQVKAHPNMQSSKHKPSVGFSAHNYNLSSFTSQVMYEDLQKLYSVNGHSYIGNPDFGKIAPGVNPSWYEIYDKRTATSARFLDEDGSTINESSYSPVNYRDKNGNYRAIDARLMKSNEGWWAPNQEYPAYLHSNGSTEMTLLNNDRLKFNLNNTIAGIPVSVKDFTVGDNGMMVQNAISGIDKKMIFGEHRIETDYIIKNRLPFSEDLTISEELILPEGYSIKQKSSDDDRNNVALIIVNARGIECGRIGKAVCYDSNKDPVLHLKAVTSGKYILRQENSRTFLDIVVSQSWLNSPDRIYPVTIDPVVNGGVVQFPAGSTFGSCLWPSFSTGGSITIQVPAGITLTNLFIQASYVTNNGDDIADGIMSLSTICGSDTLYGSELEDSFDPGTLFTDSLGNNPTYDDLLPDLGCCFAPSCNIQNITITESLSRYSNFFAGCNSDLITYDLSLEDPVAPFKAFARGRTVELAGASTTNWSVSPTSVCSNTCTVSINVPVINGVPPYTMSHPWTASIDTFGVHTINSTCVGTSSGTGVLTLNIPYCPTSCGADSTITVPLPTVKDACGNVVSITGTKTFTKKAVPVVTPNPASKSVCSGTSPNIALTSCVGSSTITWSGDGSTTTSATISDVPTNNGSLPTTVTYTVNVTHNGCPGTPITVAVTVNPLPSVSVFPASPSVCSGDSATLTASGLTTGGYTWTVSSGGLSSTSGATVKAVPGSYIVTGTDANGCTATQNVTVATSSSLTIAINPTSSTICSGKSVTLIANGATSYTWGPNAYFTYHSVNWDTVIVNTASQVVYSITGTTGGCTGYTYDTVKIGSSPTVGINTTSASICPGQLVFLSATSATAIGYLWSNGATTTTIPIISPGTFTVTGTNATGCTATYSINIPAGTVPVININPNSPTVCTGGTPVTLTASGGTTYSWSTGATTTTISVSATGQYSVTGSSAQGCATTTSVTVSPGTPPAVGVSPASPIVCTGGAPATLSATGTATSYSWSNGATTSSISVTTAGTYSVTGKSAQGCSATASVTVSPGTPPTVGVSPASPIVCTGGIPATLTTTGTATSYSWSTGATTSAISVTTTGTYTVTGTSAQGCSTTASVTVGPGTPPTVGVSPASPTVCTGGTPAMLTTTGTATSYSWSTGATTSAISVTTTGTYSVTETSAQGCSATASVTVGPGTPPAVGVSPASPTVCTGGIPATLTTTGTATSYSWSTGATTSAISVTTTGTYTVTGTSAQGCSTTASVTVGPGTPPTVGVSPASPTVCTGGTPEMLTATGTASSYSWSTGATTSAISVTTTGTYTVTGTSAQGCGTTASITVGPGTPPTVGVSPASPTVCTGGIPATLTTTGTATSYSWSTGATTSAISVTTTGTYTVTGTSAQGCGTIASVTVGPGTPPTVGVSPASPTVCTGGTPATLTTTGTASSYSWSTGATTSAISVTTTGTYTVTGTSAQGCSATASVTVGPGTPPTVGVSPASPTVCTGGTPATLTATGTASSYSWSNGATTSATSVTSTGTYSLTGTSAQGCSATTSVTVTEGTAPTILVTPNPAKDTVCSGQQIAFIASGGVSYTWSAGLSSATGDTVTGSTVGTYTVTGTDSHGCTNTATSTVNIYPPFSVDAGPDVNICPGDSTQINATGAPIGSTFSWSPPTDLTCNNCADPIAFPAAPTTYTVTATSTNNCSSTNTITVNASPLNPSVSPADTIVCFGSPLSLSATGGSTYLWTPSADLADSTSANIAITALATTTYSVTVSRGTCNAVKTIAVTVNPSPPATHINISSTGDTLSCVANPDYTFYQWYYGNNLVSSGSIDTTYVALQSGYYRVEVFDENGCTISTTRKIDLITGLLNLSSESSISLYPNPATDELTIRSSSIHGNQTVLISIMDILGKTIQQQSVNWNNETTVNIKNLSAGIYFLQLQQPEEKWIGRFVKE